uniref:Uncharacterized protein n=1 Tax=Rhizophora mucronata TaxID=61149 RepID=A0A2P2PTJ2_RHIMU
MPASSSSRHNNTISYGHGIVHNPNSNNLYLIKIASGYQIKYQYMHTWH